MDTTHTTPRRHLATVPIGLLLEWMRIDVALLADDTATAGTRRGAADRADHALDELTARLEGTTR